jgi:hypothetical protein
MDIILYALEEEKKESEKLLDRYQKEWGALPHGSFFLRKIGKNQYGYLTWSEKGEVRQEYLGALGKEEIQSYQQAMLRKKKLKQLMVQSEKQRLFLERTLKNARKKG